MSNLGGCLILWGSCAAAVAASLGVWVRLKQIKPALRCGAHMGPANWDFSESWASNLTLVGALLGTILAESGLLPDSTTYLPRASYGGLNVLFGVITVLAPLVYVAFRTAQDTVGRSGKQEVQYKGRVCGFMFASCLTLWAVLGQLPTVALLLQEMAAKDGFPPGATVLLWGLPVIGMILLMVYFCKTTYSIVKHQLEDTARTRQQLANDLARRVEDVAEIEVPQPSWSVL